MFKLNNKPLGLDTAFTTEDGTQYPSNWLRLASAEEKAAIGITEEADAEIYDDRFYWGVNSPKRLEDVTEGEITTKGLKSVWIAQIKDTANKMMQPTDWMVWRKFERGVEIPADVAAHRLAILAECDRIIAAISASETMQQFVETVSDQQWPDERVGA